MVAAEEDSDVNIRMAAFVDIDRVEVLASVAADVDAYDAIDDDNLAADAHVDVV